MNINNIGVYIRVANKDDFEIEKEKKLAKKYIKLKKFDYNKIYYYIDNGVSVNDINKNGLNQLVKDYKSNNISIIISKDISRFARNFSELKRIEDLGLKLTEINFICHDNIINDIFNKKNKRNNCREDR